MASVSTKVGKEREEEKGSGPSVGTKVESA
jgi:hypothetical protein